jgi:hypothetical protein
MILLLRTKGLAILAASKPVAAIINDVIISIYRSYYRKIKVFAEKFD